MKTSSLMMLGAAAAVLGGAAWWCNAGSGIKSSSVNGKSILPEFNVAEVAKIEIAGEKQFSLAATDSGWVAETLANHPADVTKIRENLLKLSELKAGQNAKGRKSAKTSKVAFKDAAGKVLAAVELGDKHFAKARGQMAQFGGGGYPDGRYVKFGEGEVLVKDTLDAFDGEIRSWCDTHISDKPYMDFTGVADAAKEAEYGFKTGVVCKITYKSDTNAVATVGGSVKDGGDRYLKINGCKWIYTIPSYSADSLIKAAEEAAKPKVEEKKDEKKAEVKKTEVKKAEVKKEKKK